MNRRPTSPQDRLLFIVTCSPEEFIRDVLCLTEDEYFCPSMEDVQAEIDEMDPEERAEFDAMNERALLAASQRSTPPDPFLAFGRTLVAPDYDNEEHSFAPSLPLLPDDLDGPGHLFVPPTPFEA